MNYAEIKFHVPGYGKRPGAKQRRQIVIKIRNRDGDNCWVCGHLIDFSLPREHDEAWTIEHRVPRSRGGTNLLENLRLAHRICNLMRKAPEVTN